MENEIIIQKKDYHFLSKIQNLISEKKPEKIIFDFSEFEMIKSFYIAYITSIIKQNETQEIHAEIVFKNPNPHVVNILQQINILNIGEVISE